MKLTLGLLRRLIQESIAGSDPSESYDRELSDDPALKKKSIMVSAATKRIIKRWSKSMGLSRKSNKRSRSA